MKQTNAFLYFKSCSFENGGNKFGPFGHTKVFFFCKKNFEISVLPWSFQYSLEDEFRIFQKFAKLQKIVFQNFHFKSFTKIKKKKKKPYSCPNTALAFKCHFHLKKFTFFTKFYNSYVQKLRKYSSRLFHIFLFSLSLKKYLLLY